MIDIWDHVNDAYIALYCLLLYTQRALQSCGGGGGGLSSITTSGLWIFEKRRAISFYGFHLAGEIHIQYNEAFCVETMNSKFNRKLKLYS